MRMRIRGGAPAAGAVAGTVSATEPCTAGLAGWAVAQSSGVFRSCGALGPAAGADFGANGPIKPCMSGLAGSPAVSLPGVVLAVRVRPCVRWRGLAARRAGPQRWR